MIQSLLPETWFNEKIGRLCSHIIQVNPKILGEGEFTYIDISSVDNAQKAICNVQKIKNSEAPSRARQIVHQNDILVSTVRPNLNVVALVSGQFNEAICSTGFCVLRPRTDVVDPEYLFAWVRHPEFVERLSRIARGVSYPAVSDRDVKNIQIPLPTLLEQNEIVKILRHVDYLRQLRSDADKEFKSLAIATFVNIFGDIDKNSPYHHVKLETVADIASGVTKGRNLPAHETVTVPYLRVANVQAGYLDLTDISTIDVLPNDVEKYALQQGDMLLTEGGDFDKLGRGALWEHNLENCIHQNHVFRVRANREVLLPFFLNYYLQTAYARRYFLRAAKRTTNLASINMTQLKTMPVPLPPLELQNKFAQAIYQFRTVLSAQQASKGEIEKLRQTLMVHAFSGKLTEAYRQQNFDLLSKVAAVRDTVLKDSLYSEIPLAEGESVSRRMTIANALSSSQRALWKMVEENTEYISSSRVEIGFALTPNEVKRDLDLLTLIGLSKAVNIAVTPGELGNIFFTQIYRKLNSQDDVREADLAILREAQAE